MKPYENWLRIILADAKRMLSMSFRCSSHEHVICGYPEEQLPLLSRLPTSPELVFCFFPFRLLVFWGSPLFSTKHGTEIEFYCWGPNFPPTGTKEMLLCAVRAGRAFKFNQPKNAIHDLALTQQVQCSFR